MVELQSNNILHHSSKLESENDFFFLFSLVNFENRKYEKKLSVISHYFEHASLITNSSQMHLSAAVLAHMTPSNEMHLFAVILN